jgi:hypothetical protein
MKSILIASVLGIMMFAGVVQADKFVAGPLDVDFKTGELASLPQGLVVTHTPDTVQPTFWGPGGNEWTHQTTVKSTVGPVRIIEYGYILERDGHRSYTQGDLDAFSADEFAKRFGCPDAELEPGAAYTYKWNRSIKDNLPEQVGIWYFIGVDAEGNRVKGEAPVTLQGGFDGC